MTSRAQTIVEKYDALVAQGALERDASQRAAVEKLQALADALARPGPTNAGLTQRFLRAFVPSHAAADARPLPLGAGRARQNLPDESVLRRASGRKKRRAHFHTPSWRMCTSGCIDCVRMPPCGDADPVSCVAHRDRAGNACALLRRIRRARYRRRNDLARLFSSLLASGVVVVATSNVEPSRLYEGGRNRDLFLPFIALLQERMDVVRLEAPNDYRQRREDLGQVYFTPADSCARSAIDALYRDARRRRGGNARDNRGQATPHRDSAGGGPRRASELRGALRSAAVGGGLYGDRGEVRRSDRRRRSNHGA